MTKSNQMQFRIILWPIIFLIITGSGCKKFIAIDPPQSQLASSTIFEEKYTAIAAVTGIYGSMSSMLNLAMYTGFSADEFTNYSVDLYSNAYTNTLTEINSDAPFWGLAYNYIYQSNAAYEGLINSKGITAEVKNQLLGEVKFIRAFWYFYLVNLYGDVPLAMTTDYNVIIKLPRTPVSDIYRQIINDLKDAQTLLSTDYLDSENNTTKDRVRPTKWVATALLARVYLFNKDYLNAEIQSTALIDNKSTFQILEDINSVFLKNSLESIWQLMPPSNKFQTPEGANFILNSAPNQVAISPDLLKSFETDDNRRKKWVDSITVSAKVYHFPFKYKIRKGSVELKEYSMVLRLAEQYLIRAEARVQQNNLKNGAEDLDVIRFRAGLKTIGTLSKNELLKAILHERQIELFSEGHRWIDLKQSGSIDEVMSKVTPSKGGGQWNSYQQLYPIPLYDIQNSKNLKQSPGY